MIESVKNFQQENEFPCLDLVSGDTQIDLVSGDTPTFILLAPIRD